MYEECCIGFRSKDLFVPEKINFEIDAKEILLSKIKIQFSLEGKGLLS